MRILFILLLIFLFGCGDDWKAKVDSDTSWSGFFGNRTVDGTGNKIIDLPDDDVICCTVQKETENGLLRVELINETSNIFASDDSKIAYTKASYGVVTICTE